MCAIKERKNALITEYFAVTSSAYFVVSSSLILESWNVRVLRPGLESQTDFWYVFALLGQNYCFQTNFQSFHMFSKERCWNHCYFWNWIHKNGVKFFFTALNPWAFGTVSFEGCFERLRMPMYVSHVSSFTVFFNIWLHFSMFNIISENWTWEPYEDLACC